MGPWFPSRRWTSPACNISKAPVGVNQSVDGRPLSIGGRILNSGIGIRAPGILLIDLNGQGQGFTASVGIDDEETDDSSSVEFQVYADGDLLWRSGLLRKGDAPVPVEVPLEGRKILALIVNNGPESPSGTHCDWGVAQMDVAREMCRTITTLPQAPARS